MTPPITDKEYCDIALSKTPMPKRGKEHTIKEKENLWSIAKKELGKKARRSDISDYTYQIAKLNNMKSLGEMNKLKVNQKIYLPDRASANTAQKASQTAAKTATATTATAKTGTTPTVKNTQTQAQAKPKSNAILGFERVSKVIQTDDKTTRIIHDDNVISIKTYTLYTTSERSNHPDKISACFITDLKDNILEISFNGERNEKATSFDYTLDCTGKIYKTDNFGISKTHVETLPKKETQQIMNTLKQRVAKLNK